MKQILFFVCFGLVACGSEKSLPYEVVEQEKEVWVCHSPDTPEHNKVCTERCFEPGNKQVFCWLLEEKDCKVNPRYEWQHVCRPLFQEE